MPKNVMKLLKPSPHRGRNDFDLSHRHVLDANFGELLPVTSIETVPGDNITLHASDLIRAIPLVTSPFLRAKQHLDVWFVPYRDLWHNFDSFITQKEQPVSSALKSAAYLPHTTIYDLANGVDYLNSQFGRDAVGRLISDRAGYLTQLLGYGSLPDPTDDPQVSSHSVNLFRLAAYNYIWYNEYRQQYYDDGSNLLSGSSVNPSYLFNFDWLTCDTKSNAYLDSTLSNSRKSILGAMCQMRYRTWKKDLVMGLLPSTQFGSVSTVYSSNVRVVDTVNIGTTSDTLKGYRDDLDLVIRQGTSTNGSKLAVRDLDVLALRKSEAVQIWRENALRAGNRIADNMLAHYGVESDFRDHRPTYLGSVDAPLNIGDVMTTANSSTGINDAVGDIAGKGLSSLDEKVFKFHAKDFGVIMVIFSMLPEGEYEARGIERNNQLLEYPDFFIPEFENLGLEAVSSVNFYRRKTTQNVVMGYAPRYYGYKQKLDQCFGAFTGAGVFRAWTSQREDLRTWSWTGTAIPLQCLYVNPEIFDANFSQSVANMPQFLVDIYFDVDAVRPMSVTGLPFS